MVVLCLTEAEPVQPTCMLCAAVASLPSLLPAATGSLLDASFSPSATCGRVSSCQGIVLDILCRLGMCLIIK
jgi:hypothetical protein